MEKQTQRHKPSLMLNSSQNPAFPTLFSHTRTKGCSLESFIFTGEQNHEYSDRRNIRTSFSEDVDTHNVGISFLRLKLEDAFVARRQMVLQAEFMPALSEAALGYGATFPDLDFHRRMTAFGIHQDEHFFAHHVA